MKMQNQPVRDGISRMEEIVDLGVIAGPVDGLQSMGNLQQSIVVYGDDACSCFTQSHELTVKRMTSEGNIVESLLRAEDLGEKVPDGGEPEDPFELFSRGCIILGRRLRVIQNPLDVRQIQVFPR